MSANIMDQLLEPQMTKICAPMVRYSKLAFRCLVRKYGCDICFTPMILADSFVQSSKARDSEFSTSNSDRPLIVQFAAKNTEDFVRAAEMISPFSDGVDLNCGCPQRWAMKDGYGADLLTKPQKVKDLIYQCRNQIAKPFTVSVKIRILKDMKKCVELCRQIECAGASFLTVHARTPDMRSEPIDIESLKMIRTNVSIPVIANGNVKNHDEAKVLYEESKCNGIMVANGLLSNPALFSGFLTTPLECIQDWLDITTRLDTQFMCMHHHFIYMLEKVLPKKERLVFNVLNNRQDVLDFLEQKFSIVPRPSNWKIELTTCDYISTKLISPISVVSEPAERGSVLSVVLVAGSGGGGAASSLAWGAPKPRAGSGGSGSFSFALRGAHRMPVHEADLASRVVRVHEVVHDREDGAGRVHAEGDPPEQLLVQSLLEVLKDEQADSEAGQGPGQVRHVRHPERQLLHRVPVVNREAHVRARCNTK
ncbi:hypothetical protein QAD02_017312 [Eretmocerus hayati]|uniref:Uncharacterized protein n=1 Tax=Eretmocerus hayati TaxID=131215 RepID=A0ACC2PD30_9HYME|nr:hypothetical protein QAD02_017312 [Eretmocerus hayati]